MRISRRKLCRDDRLSELPDSLIHLILSFLPMRYVARTSLLSNRWRHLWTTTPFLDFRSHTYINSKLRKSVRVPLALWKGIRILKFNIDCLFNRCLTSDIDSWLIFAIEKQVEELSVELTEYAGSRDFHHNDYYPRDRMESDYYAPQRLYSCSSITKLSLVSCRLNIDGDVQWNQLKSLTIEGTESLSEDAMNRILTGAPRLEVLNLCIRESSERSLNIESTSLKTLSIDMYLTNYSDHRVSKDAAALRIRAPNLERLEISRVPCRCLLNCPSLTNVSLAFRDRDYRNIGCVVFEEMVELMLSISHVEKVTLTDWCIKVLLEMKKKGMAVSFSNAKFLKLYASEANEVLGVLEMFPKLMFIVLVLECDNIIHRCCSLNKEPSVDVKVDGCNSLLHLRSVEISWDTSIIPVIEILLENAHVLENMVFRLRNCRQPLGRESVSLAENKVRSMPRSSPTADVIIRRER